MKQLSSYAYAEDGGDLCFIANWGGDTTVWSDKSCDEVNGRYICEIPGERHYSQSLKNYSLRCCHFSPTKFLLRYRKVRPCSNGAHVDGKVTSCKVTT